jgi:hypothetical protein
MGLRARDLAPSTLPPRTTSERGDRPRADSCFALAEQQSDEAGRASLLLVRSGHVVAVPVGSRSATIASVLRRPRDDAVHRAGSVASVAPAGRASLLSKTHDDAPGALPAPQWSAAPGAPKRRSRQRRRGSGRQAGSNPLWEPLSPIWESATIRSPRRPSVLTNTPRTGMSKASARPSGDHRDARRSGCARVGARALRACSRGTFRRSAAGRAGARAPGACRSATSPGRCPR